LLGTQERLEYVELEYALGRQDLQTIGEARPRRWMESVEDRAGVVAPAAGTQDHESCLWLALGRSDYRHFTVRLCLVCSLCIWAWVLGHMHKSIFYLQQTIEGVGGGG